MMIAYSGLHGNGQEPAAAASEAHELIQTAAKGRCSWLG